MEKHYSPKEMSQLLGVTVKTLQNWDYAGRLKAYRTPTNRRYYTHRQYLEYIGASPDGEMKGKTVIYARVSKRSQMDDLKNQVLFLQEFANAKGWIIDAIFEDIGSGLNYNREKWNQLLEETMRQKVSRIIIAHKDRFVRFGFEWFERFLKTHGVELVIVHNEKLSPEQELVQDLVSIIHVFSNRIIGLKKYKKKLREDPDVKGIQNSDGSYS